ncbi:adenosine kinase-like isoform X2 [Rhynchophorus ferrugineus]|uniref:adenosine kinase-like isoform X2 n=1 Tax=Rhynchophorus ferrugineus TaxID=354439 RepID=UPI003FCC2D17
MLICFGSPLIDITVQVKNEFLTKYNIEADRAIRAQPHNEELVKEILDLNPTYSPGGSITNTARIAKWISKDRHVIFVGVVGNDVYGEKISNKLKEENVDCYLVTTDLEETGKCIVLNSDNGKHRSLITDLGASKLFSSKDLQNNILQDKMTQSSFVYISTFFLGISVDVTRSIINYFKECNKKIIVNLGATFIINIYLENVKYLYENANVIIGNEEEYLNLAAVNGIDKSQNLEGITRASKPVLVYHNKLFKYFNVKSVKNIIDTNGAGDAFAGGFLAKYIEGLIGSDRLGYLIKDQLIKEDINFYFFEQNDTVQCAVLVSDNGKQRSLLTNSLLISKNNLDVQALRLEFSDNLQDIIKKSSFFYAPTFSLGSFSKQVKEIAEHFYKNQKKIIINLGAIYILQKYIEDSIYLLKISDVVIGNEEEYRTVANIFDTPQAAENDIESLLKDILPSIDGGGKILIVTNGSEQIVSYYHSKFKYYPVPYVENVIDTTGAGDAFAGGFLAEFVKGSELDVCIQLGIKCASDIVQVYGCDIDGIKTKTFS